METHTLHTNTLCFVDALHKCAYSLPNVQPCMTILKVYTHCKKTVLINKTLILAANILRVLFPPF